MKQATQDYSTSNHSHYKTASNTETRTEANKEKTIQVWDILIRVFHWSLVLFVLILFITEDDFLSIHSYAGYTVLLLLGFRIIWGFIGTYYARFSSFITTPKAAIYI